MMRAERPRDGEDTTYVGYYDDDGDDGDGYAAETACAAAAAVPDLTRIEDPSVTRPRPFADNCVFACAQVSGWLCRLACVPVIAWSDRHAPVFRGYGMPAAPSAHHAAAAPRRRSQNVRACPKVPAAPSARYLTHRRRASRQAFEDVDVERSDEEDGDGVSASGSDVDDDVAAVRTHDRHSGASAASQAEMYATVERESDDDDDMFDDEDDNMITEISGVRIMRSRYDQRAPPSSPPPAHASRRTDSSDERESLSDSVHEHSDDEDYEDELDGFATKEDQCAFQNTMRRELLNVALDVSERNRTAKRTHTMLATRAQQKRRRRSQAMEQHALLTGGASDSEYDTQSESSGPSTEERAKNVADWWQSLHEHMQHLVKQTSDVTVIRRGIEPFLEECKAYLRPNNALDQYKRRGTGVDKLPDVPEYSL